MPSPTRIIVAITGASGAVYGIRVLEQLAEMGVETHLILSPWAERTIALETGRDCAGVRETASRVWEHAEMDAAVASGSFPVDGMVVAPCSMKTLAGIRHGLAGDLICRAADVSLKERRRLVLLVRETPLSEIHLENMLGLARMGAVIMPPVPAFYTRPGSVEDLVNQTAARAIGQLGLDPPGLRRWEGNETANEKG